MDGCPFLPNEIHMDDISKDLKIPDPGVYLDGGVYLRFRDLLEHLRDEYAGQIWDSITESRIQSEIHGMNIQLSTYRSAFRIKWYFFPHRNHMELVIFKVKE